MARLILARHGQSEWNEKNLFTGWADVELTQQGIQQAIDGGKLLKEANLEVDIAYTSVLKRAIKTTELMLEYSDQMWVPIVKHWRLNERHYGDLTGKNKLEAVKQFGEEQVHLWRRSYDVLPPQITPENPYFSHIDRRYKKIESGIIPKSENLKLTYERVLPYWEDIILPHLWQDETVLIGAHGNSIRALIKHIKHLNEDEVVDVEIPNYPPMVIEFDKDLTIKQEYMLG